MTIAAPQQIPIFLQKNHAALSSLMAVFSISHTQTHTHTHANTHTNKQTNKQPNLSAISCVKSDPIQLGADLYYGMVPFLSLLRNPETPDDHFIWRVPEAIYSCAGNMWQQTNSDSPYTHTQNGFD